MYRGPRAPAASSRVRSAAVTGTKDQLELLAANSFDIPDIRESLRRRDKRPGRDEIRRLSKDSVRFRIVCGSGPIRRSSGSNGAERAVDTTQYRWSERRRSHLVSLENVQRFLAQRRRKVDHIIGHFEILTSVGRRFRRMRLRR